VTVLTFGAMTTEDMQDDHERLALEEADAWFEYLEALRADDVAGRYDELETWAWARLRQRLNSVETARARLSPAAA
jgi:hypothetical protein